MDDYDGKDGEENDEDPFEWYYELDDDKEVFWYEMSYRKFDRKTTWSDLELNDLELFLLEEG